MVEDAENRAAFALKTRPKMGLTYRRFRDEARPWAPTPIDRRGSLAQTKAPFDLGIPQPALDHLIRLTDDTGLLQHARFTIPNRAHGYCTDDNARGAIAAVKHYTEYRDPRVLRLLDTYLAFLMHAQNADGTIHNFLDFNRRWWENEPAHDGFGRAVWALGTVLAHPPAPEYLSVMKDCFDRTTAHIQRQSPRGLAYCILGLGEYLRQFPGVPDIEHHVERAAGSLVCRYRETRAPGWDWFERFLTYDNAVLPHALFVAGLILDRGEFIEVAARTTEFLLEATLHDDHFSFIGTRGWYERGRIRAAFDQQPVEAAAMVMALRAAYDATKEARFLHLQRLAFDWFLGANDLGLALYDLRTKGCSDGLMAGGVNGNQGAESTVSFFLSLLAIIESCAVTDKAHGRGTTAGLRADATDELVGNSSPSEGTEDEKDATQSQVGKAT